LYHLEKFLSIKRIFISERCHFLQQKRENNLKWIREEQNIWKYVKPIFHTFSPPFRGLKIYNDMKESRPEEIVKLLADYYEKHFAEPCYDKTNPTHINSLKIYDEIALVPNISLDQIKYEEVLNEWKKFRPKKSTDSVSTSAFLLKKLPMQYMFIITILFNRCAENGDFF
jgi:hypothetical protein